MVVDSLRNIPVLDDSMREHNGLLIYGHGLIAPSNGHINPLVIVSNTHRRMSKAPIDLEPEIAEFLERHLGSNEFVACVHYSDLSLLNVVAYISAGNENSFPQRTKSTYYKADSRASRATRIIENMVRSGKLPNTNGHHNCNGIDLLMRIE